MWNKCCAAIVSTDVKRSLMERQIMIHRLFVLFIGAILLIAAVPRAAAQCIPCPPDQVCPMVCRPIVPGVFTDPDWLKVDYHRVRVTVDRQVARTTVEMAFTNQGNGLAEGTFLFPLPMGAGVEELLMIIDGVAIEARVLDAREARAIYDAIVRQYRDPALLEYVGRSAVQANVFPIPPGETRQISLTYTQVLEVDNGLVHYVYPLDVTRLTSRRTVGTTSVSVQVTSADPIGSIYSPSHSVAVQREGDRAFRAGWEVSESRPDDDFSLYWGIESDVISLNLLTWRDSADEDGFFMLLVQPPIDVPDEVIVPRDVILVLDQSGSMNGEKWDQARRAAAIILESLNPEDRFSAVLFSTGWRLFSDRLEPASVAAEAVDWINRNRAEGGTNIDGALRTALAGVDRERPTTLIFLTDGLATEGETNTRRILENVAAAAPSNVRLFTFGVGNDVDTILLGALVEAHRGASAYVRPGERIDEAVASLVNKIGAPVLTDPVLTVDGVRVELVYPSGRLPDLFAGNQLTLVGRYRGSAENARITLTGRVGDQQQTFTYDGLSFRQRAGGDAAVARLWATRRIADLLETIRLNGENRELIDSIVALSIRFGIITPYTSFLIEEDDILSQRGRAEAEAQLNNTMRELSMSSSGAAAVDAADAFAQMRQQSAPALMPISPRGGIPGTPSPQATMSAPGGAFPPPSQPTSAPIRAVEGKTFLLQNGVWTDTTFQPDTMTPVRVAFLSDAYFDLLDAQPELAPYFALGERVIVVLNGTAYEVTA
jgi:Ca-activated chloride channel family protein